MTQKIILIDSNNIAYRAFYALPDTIITSTGVMTNAVLGFTNMFLKIIEDFKPDRVVCAFDSKGPTFRHKMFDQYKIHRKPMPEGLLHQLPLIREVMESFNISCIEMESMEADDILASIARKAEEGGNDAIIVTGDKDMLQMVSDKIKVLSSKRSITDTITYDPEGVAEKMGVGPELVKDLLALMGDSSDNIPGVPGIGPKTAVKLIREFGSLEDIYNNIDRIKSEKLKELLVKNEEIARTSKELTALKDDLNIDSDLIENSFKDIDYKRVKEVFEKLEFTSLIKRLPRYAGIMGVSIKEEAGNGVSLKEIELEKYTDSLPGVKDKKQIFIVPVDPGEKRLILYPGGGKAFLADTGLPDILDSSSNIRAIMQDPGIIKTGMGLKQAAKILKKKGIELQGRLLDLEIMYLALNPLKSAADIPEIASRILGIDIDNMGLPGSAVDESSPGETQMSLDFEEGEDESMGGGEEASLDKYSPVLKELALYGELASKLEMLLEENSLTRLYEEIEEPLINVLAEIENTGVAIDTDYLNELIKEYNIEIKKLTQDIYTLCGQEFNINSSQQLAEVLYEKMELPAVKKTKTGYSTDAASLKAIRDKSPVIDKILDYREKTKLKNTYVDVLPRLIDPEDGRVHTNYNQMGTTTGRISSNDPNLQNIPVRTLYGKQIRKAFIPGEGYDLLMASDYSQIELRILAHLSGDSNLIDSFNREEDIHDRTASEIFGVDYEDVPSDLRRKAKAINFGIIYGMTDFGLASRLSIPGGEAREYIKKYFERYPMVDKYLKDLIESAAKNGYSTTMFGRKRYIRELGSSNARIRSLGERYAVNTPIQGSAADIMKLSTIRLHEKLVSAGVDSNIILHVHDEIVLELKEKDIEIIENIIRESMENILRLKVKLKVDINIGKNWYI
jgi:DNA polymerase-1